DGGGHVLAGRRQQLAIRTESQAGNAPFMAGQDTLFLTPSKVPDADRASIGRYQSLAIALERYPAGISGMAEHGHFPIRGHVPQADNAKLNRRNRQQLAVRAKRHPERNIPSDKQTALEGGGIVNDDARIVTGCRQVAAVRTKDDLGYLVQRL